MGEMMRWVGEHTCACRHDGLHVHMCSCTLVAVGVRVVGKAARTAGESGCAGEYMLARW